MLLHPGEFLSQSLLDSEQTRQKTPRQTAFREVWRICRFDFAENTVELDARERVSEPQLFLSAASGVEMSAQPRCHWKRFAER